MKIVQILPEMNAGGVELCTLELSTLLVRHGHESIVISHGGRLVAELEAAGARHVAMPVHRKSLATLLQVGPLRRFLAAEKPDILHIHSRVPGWIAWLAWRGMDPATRPRLVSTVHGFYSVNAYSAVMTRGERVIAVSHSIRLYILENYPACPPERIRVIHHGIEPAECGADFRPSAEWLERWHAEHPELAGKSVLLLPGRITRWKGHEDFVRLIATLKTNGLQIHGLVAGDTHPKKRAFAAELHALAEQLGVAGNLTFLGHRPDIREVMAVSDIVLSLSRDPEAFGRVSLEAMALGKPVVGYDHGGVGEQLDEIFPRGKVTPKDPDELAARVSEILRQPTFPTSVGPFTRRNMFDATLAAYHELLREKP
jgi:glycosyltransferase involved in cell wall biosynthesis